MAIAPDWAGLVNTTTQEYITKEEVNVLRNRRLTAMLQKRGRISFNHSGLFMDWKVRWKQAPMEGYSDGDTQVFARQDREKTAQLDWRAYTLPDMVSKFEKLKNEGKEGIVKIYSQIVEFMMLDIKEQFGDEFYVDGNAAANLKRFHGVETMFAGATAQAGNFVGVNAATYAGLATTLANYGGAWTGTWPTGTGDVQYDFWSPLLIDTTNTAWSSATKTFAANAKQQLRYAIIKARKNKSLDGKLDLLLFNDEMFRSFEDALDSEERILVSKGNDMFELGFGDTVNFEGCDVTYEYGVPSNVGYGWSMANAELCIMQDKLFKVDGPDYDVGSKSWRYSVDCFGNLKMNPRNFCKFMVLSS